MTKNKKYQCDIGFYSYEFTVSARNLNEAKRKMKEKLKKIPMSRVVNKNTTYIDEI